MCGEEYVLSSLHSDVQLAVHTVDSCTLCQPLIHAKLKVIKIIQYRYTKVKNAHTHGQNAAAGVTVERTSEWATLPGGQS